MHRDPKTRQLTAFIMAAVMMFTSLPLGSLQAGMVSTNQLLEEGQAPGADQVEENSPRSRVQAFLARDDVRAEMIGLGITPIEAEARVAAMTDQEVTDLAGRLDELPAGGFGVGTVLVILFVVFGVTVLLDALGLIDIYPFVCGRGPCGEPQQAAIQQESLGVPEDDFALQNRRPIYQNDRFNEDDRFSRSRRDDRRLFQDDDRRVLDPNGFEQQLEPQPRVRNYFDERTGSRQVR